MAEIGLKLRTAAPSGDWRSFVIPTTAAVVAGHMDLIHDTVGVYAQSVVVADIGADVAFIYHAEKIVVPKVAATGGPTFEIGDKVFYVAATHNVGITGGGNLWIGIALQKVGALDTEVLIDLKGDKAT